MAEPDLPRPAPQIWNEPAGERIFPRGAPIPPPDGARIPLLPPDEEAVPEGQSYDVTDVMAFGAAGDGREVTDEVMNAIEATPNGGVVYFPHGTYEMEVEVVGRSCLTFVGDGACSTLRWNRGGPILTFRDCTNITITRLGFEGNNYLEADEAVAPLGLLVAESCRRFRVTQTRWRNARPFVVPSNVGAVDSLTPQRPGMRLFGGDRVAEDLWLHDNSMTHYGIAVHHARRVRIAANTIEGAVGHGIWVGSFEREDSVAEDVVIGDNVVIDPLLYGVAVLDRGVVGEDRHGLSILRALGSSVRSVRVLRNAIRRGESAEGNVAWAAIRVGAHPSITRGDSGGEYSDIVVEGNHCEGDKPKAPEDESHVGIYFWLPVGRLGRSEQDALVTGPSFERAVVRGNTVRGILGDGIALEQLRYSVVGDNAIRDCRRGLVLSTNVFQNHVHRNSVIGIEADEYVLHESLGMNWLNGDVTLSRGNRIDPGDGRAHWRYEAAAGALDDHFFGTDLKAD